MLELSYELPDVVRWRNFLLGDRRVASVPLDSIERAVAFKGFHVHLNSSLSDVALAGNGKVTGKVGSQRFRFDHLDCGHRLSHRFGGAAGARAHPRGR